MSLVIICLLNLLGSASHSFWADRTLLLWHQSANSACSCRKSQPKHSKEMRYILKFFYCRNTYLNLDTYDSVVFILIWVVQRNWNFWPGISCGESGDHTRNGCFIVVSEVGDLNIELYIVLLLNQIPSQDGPHQGDFCLSLILAISCFSCQFEWTPETMAFFFFSIL